MFDASAGPVVNEHLNLRPDLKEYSVARPADCSEFGERRSWQLESSKVGWRQAFQQLNNRSLQLKDKLLDRLKLFCCRTRFTS